MSFCLFSPSRRIIAWDGEGASGLYRCTPEEGKKYLKEIQSPGVRVKYTPPPGQRISGDFFSPCFDQLHRVEATPENIEKCSRGERGRVTTGWSGYGPTGY